MLDGCCRDKKCTPADCMALPVGNTCGECGHFQRCKWLLSRSPEETGCDWWPRRFQLPVLEQVEAE